ncbi:MAG TPA: phytanoyl-CoA dioxygenase family protein, partial [Emcibacteraceae bacterium]|nr:phytanoyl-CoA dioxygenase family protein [Emcibacteraceae bacterium]
DGVVKVSGAFDPKWVEFLRKATEENMNNPGEMAEEYAKAENSTRFFGDQYIWTRNNDFKKFVFESEAAKIAAELMGSSKINMFFDHLLVKEPGSVEPTPWHQDGPYWKIKGEQICSIWFAMDDVSEENGGVRYVKGSHRTGIRYRPQSFSGKGHAEYGEAGLEVMPDIDQTVPEDQIICYDLKPGDCLIHHANIIHGARGNKSAATRRRGYATRWTGDDVVWDPRKGTTEVLKDPGLKPGDPLDSDLFPVVWRNKSSDC